MSETTPEARLLVVEDEPRSMGGSDNAAEIAAWVADNFAPTSVGGTTVYDLTATG